MNILIINGHPDANSFTNKLATSLFNKKSKKAEKVTLLNIRELDFNPVFSGYGSLRDNPIEEDLQESQRLIQESDHIVLITPIWWSTYPALLKGFLDKVLLPNFAFKFSKGKMTPTKLLEGRTAELFLISDAPSWYRRFILRDPAANILKRDVLGFCGIKVTKVHRIGEMGKQSPEERASLIQEACLNF